MHYAPTLSFSSIAWARWAVTKREERSMQGEHPAMRVAVIGLGVMGAGMARHLAEEGYTVTVYNRTRARAQELAPHGVTIAATPRDAAAASEAVILMLSDDRATRACTDGPDGVLAGLAPGTLVLQMAT